MTATSNSGVGRVPLSPQAPAEGSSRTAGGVPDEAPPELLVDAGRAAELAQASLAWPSLTVGAGVLADLELLLLGLSGPVAAFRGPEDPAEPGGSGDAPAPRLVVDAPAAASLSAGDRVALRDTEGVMVAALTVTAMAPDNPDNCGTGGAGRVQLAGPLEGVGLPHHPDYPELRLTPTQLRAELSRRGWQAWAAWADGLLHTADLDRLRGLLAQGRGVVVLAPVGGADPSDPRHHLRVRCLRAALSDLAGAGGADVPLVLVPVRPVAQFGASPGAPPGDVDETDATHARARLAAGYGLAGSLVGPAPGSPALAVLTEALGAGRPVPAELTPPAVAAELARAYPPRRRRGLTVLFTGLSGSGKSTLANLLTCRLLERGDRDVTLLDGDVVRHHLSAGLGFSRADRDTNVRRIGFVAAQASGAGGTVVCAPIAPYASVRAEARAMVERRGAGFVLVHVATPLAVCEGRDRKGLYAKARAGIIPAFTGVSDPYEEPTDAEVVIDTSELSPDEAVEAVLRHLRSAGWLPPAQA